ncbi:MAG: hypothetical protein IPF73_14215 [Betaproteobacteria bacterium]|nr:hypothetical protein [Betaproteobacteria bacterium]
MAALRAHPALRAVVRGRARTASIVSTYFGTPDQRLRREGVALQAAPRRAALADDG